MDWKNLFLKGVEFLFLGSGAWFDVKGRVIPVKHLAFFGIVVIGLNMLWKYQSFYDAFAGGCIGAAFLFVGWITKEAIGYGDGLGIMIIGILLGWKKMFCVVFTAFLLSGICGIWKLVVLKESRDKTMPFYPFLLAASIGVTFL